MKGKKSQHNLFTLLSLTVNAVVDEAAQGRKRESWLLAERVSVTSKSCATRGKVIAEKIRIQGQDLFATTDLILERLMEMLHRRFAEIMISWDWNYAIFVNFQIKGYVPQLRAMLVLCCYPLKAFFKIIAKGCLFILHPFYSLGLNRSLES